LPQSPDPFAPDGDLGLAGRSAAMAEVRRQIRRYAGSDEIVLITGESGVGKSHVAYALHGLSRRADAPFVAHNVNAVAPSLVESGWFGHVRGAFTDAKSNRTGLFAETGAGTLFLDEIGDLALDLQAKLLHVVEQRTFTPVGSDKPLAFRGRIVCATNRNLGAGCQRGRFREDLYWRLSTLTIHVPPLRDRMEDIGPIAHATLTAIARETGRLEYGVDPGAFRPLLDHDWPGNVRELVQVVKRSVGLPMPFASRSRAPGRLRWAIAAISRR
jgi:DNA-binding NtrC family response regulator